MVSRRPIQCEAKMTGRSPDKKDDQTSVERKKKVRNGLPTCPLSFANRCCPFSFPGLVFFILSSLSFSLSSSSSIKYPTPPDLLCWVVNRRQKKGEKDPELWPKACPRSGVFVYLPFNKRPSVNGCKQKTQSVDVFSRLREYSSGRRVEN